MSFVLRGLLLATCSAAFASCLIYGEDLLEDDAGESGGTGGTGAQSGGDGGDGGRTSDCELPEHCPGEDTTCAFRTCEQGACGYSCSPNFADCDSDTANGCETDVLSDPMNCGGCGIRCDGVEGQPCVDGKCLTKECDIK